jgi:hypothetical protein
MFFYKRFLQTFARAQVKECLMGYVTKEEIECKSCGRIIRKNELQYDSPEGRICLNYYTGKQPARGFVGSQQALHVKSLIF